MDFRRKLALILALICSEYTQSASSIGTQKLKVILNSDYSHYSIVSGKDIYVQAEVAAKVNQHWVHASDYPHHSVTTSPLLTDLGQAQQLMIRHSGLPLQPDLICLLKYYPKLNVGEIEVSVTNNSHKAITVQAIRLLEAADPGLTLKGNNQFIRVLSDTYSENRPTLQIYDLAAAPQGVHRAVGSQLIYHRQTHDSFFVGALTSSQFLTIMRLQVQEKSSPLKIEKYEIDSTGTTEINKDFSLNQAPDKNLIEINLPVKAGQQLSSERVMFSISSDYHAQLELYGKLIRTLHHARVTAPTPMGWWSWTAYYRDITQRKAMENAQWLSQHLLALGYDFFHLDDGYEFARGDYLQTDVVRFPESMPEMGKNVHKLGLTFGIWTAPFEVSNRSELYRQHKDWLVKNADGDPISIGFIIEDGKDTDELYALDATHPGAQTYLRETYSTLAKQWGARYIKLDFMDDSTIEGYRFQPNVTALQAQRIGMNIIREAVGDDVLLDKDGSPMLNMVGYADMGRISVDTGHHFADTKASAVGIAARYYMNRNFYMTDPDAFTVSRYRTGLEDPLTLDEAKTSIALAAISGGMYEIGDNLTLLGLQPERLALVENKELIHMAQAGQAGVPIDLMDYSIEDAQPSIFLLRQNANQAILTVFNWTEASRVHMFNVSDLGFAPDVQCDVTDVLSDGKLVKKQVSQFTIKQPLHSVQMLKLRMSGKRA
jgi:alpha-galactosidase